MPTRVNASARRIRRLAAGVRRAMAQTVPLILVKDITNGLSIARAAGSPSDAGFSCAVSRLAEGLVSSKTSPRALQDAELAVFLMLRERLTRRHVAAAFDESAARVDWILSEEINGLIGEMVK